MPTYISEATDACPLPVILLKTKSTPDDTYEEHFRSVASINESSEDGPLAFAPHFLPVLEHTRNEPSLQELKDLLMSRQLKQKYGGMIFTSQRAVEAWTDVVNEVSDGNSSLRQAAKESDPFGNIDALTAFPLYVVGPATERALQSLIASLLPSSPFRILNPSVHGAHTGNGASLATFILDHYNWLYGRHWFEYFEAPRLPFIPLLGMSSQNYGRKRLEKDDPRLAKKPLLFLVGEVRRDIIPKTLTGADDSRRIGVNEVEVYRTEVMKSLETNLDVIISNLDQEARTKESRNVRIIVVFSPQGTEAVLKKIGYLDNLGRPTHAADNRWYKQDLKSNSNTVSEHQSTTNWLIATIGPTTRDYMKDRLGVEPDICAERPSPEVLRNGIENFLKSIKSTR